LSNQSIKDRTGFENETLMLSFIILVCNGDFDLMKQTESSLTWFEEWLVYFDTVWGRNGTRWNTTSLERFGVANRNVLYKIFDAKNHLILRCRSSWPSYASHKEDKHLRKEKWNVKYGERRIVMWDDTNIPFDFKPSGAKNQRSTFSCYYGMNCAKGGVFAQLCGWMGVWELFVGAISDSSYVEKSGLLEVQEEFAKIDKIDGTLLPFTLILDKGYRIIRICWRNGKQECIQPTFAKSDRRFSSNEMLVSASIAADRSGNERAVKRCKEAGYLKRGLKANGCPERLNNVWMAWSFQVNFMYDSVL
jgi:hypothetical protein